MAERTITTTGIGRANVVPTKLRLAMGIESKASTAADALRALWDDLAALASALDANGVGAADRQTSGLNVAPAYDPRKGEPDGYQASCAVTAIVSDVTSAAACIDAAVAQVADRFRLHHMTWIAEPTDADIANARAAAIAEAVGAAEQMARAAGTALGPIRTIVEGPLPSVPVHRRLMGGTALAATPMPDFDPGEVGFVVAVEIVHELA